MKEPSREMTWRQICSVAALITSIVIIVWFSLGSAFAGIVATYLAAVVAWINAWRQDASRAVLLLVVVGTLGFLVVLNETRENTLRADDRADLAFFMVYSQLNVVRNMAVPLWQLSEANTNQFPPGPVRSGVEDRVSEHKKISLEQAERELERLSEILTRYSGHLPEGAADVESVLISGRFLRPESAKAFIGDVIKAIEAVCRYESALASFHCEPQQN